MVSGKDSWGSTADSLLVLEQGNYMASIAEAVASDIDTGNSSSKVAAVYYGGRGHFVLAARWTVVLLVGLAAAMAVVAGSSFSSTASRVEFAKQSLIQGSTRMAVCVKLPP